MKCIYCGKPVSEQEFQERYNELSERGIIPTMLPSHKDCRENRTLSRRERHQRAADAGFDTWEDYRGEK